jgi:hypothetical protein
MRLLRSLRWELVLVAAWCVILWETTFPIAILAPNRVRWVLLGLGACFHIGVAVGMGLNTFLWAFVATYPAVEYCAITLQAP